MIVRSAPLVDVAAAVDTSAAAPGTADSAVLEVGAPGSRAPGSRARAATDSGSVATHEPPTARGRRTRERLLAAAREVFEREGFLAARTTDIAEAAGVAHGSFYTYFPGKEEIFAALLGDLQDELLRPGVGRPADDRAAGRASESPAERIRAAHRDYLVAYRRNARLMAAMEQAALVDERIRRVRLERERAFSRRNARAIARWQSAGLADPSLEPLPTARALDAMVSRMAEMVFVHGVRTSLDDLVDLLTRLWCGALGIAIEPTTKER
ncbi:MAG: TetR/AcrR family transcriptional regulator [Solirubrobacteraceae bacterium]|nr:TetR/AcrR family transcriptional regulator [Solirubrobacteraceae bacterium]